MRLLDNLSIKRKKRRTHPEGTHTRCAHCGKITTDDVSTSLRPPSYEVARISPPPILPPIRPASRPFISNVDIRISTISARVTSITLVPPTPPPKDSGKLYSKHLPKVPVSPTSPTSPTRPPRPPSLALTTILSDITPTVRVTPAINVTARQKLRRLKSHVDLRPKYSDDWHNDQVNRDALVNLKESQFQLHTYSSDGSLSRRFSTTRVVDSAWLIPIPVQRSFEFPWQFGGTIGEGGFGKVVLGLHLPTKQVYAVKIVALRRVRTKREAEGVVNEINVLRRVSQMEGATSGSFLARPGSGFQEDWYWQYGGNVHIIMDYYPGGDLSTALHYHNELRNPAFFKLMVAEVTLGVLALHSMGVIHNDIKPSNILVDRQGHCVLTDFGCSSFVKHNSLPGISSAFESYPPIFTLRYAAPESLNDGALGLSIGLPVGPTVDYWSFGVTLFELAVGKELIEDTDENVVLYKIQHGLIDMAQLVFLLPFPGLRLFVNALLDYNPTTRLKDTSIREHEYFADYSQDDWKAIEERKRPPFRPDKQTGVDPHNNSYHFSARPGESILDDANEDTVNKWFMDLGVNVPHHRESESHKFHGKNARLGLPYQPVPQYSEVIGNSVSLNYF